MMHPALACLLALALIQAPPASDQTEVTTTVQRFFDAMLTRDVAAMKALFTPEATLVSTRIGADGRPTARPTNAMTYADGLANGTDKFLERMWNPEVRVNGAIATLWTRYDFHRNGTFTHCGVDAFNLVKSADGWKIASAMWTVETTNCAPSPLGPPK